MGDKTGIEWTDATWNPVSGCTKVSQGCKNCYAERDWKRLVHLPAYQGRAFTDVACHPDRLDQPIRWKKPRRIFVNSMSDLFHPDVPFDFIERVFETMTAAHQHTFQILTKRPERMREFMCDMSVILPNVWLGVSVEDQAAADERIPLLLDTPAVVRWVSMEPLLGPVALTRIETKFFAGKLDALRGLFKWDQGEVTREPTSLDWVVVGGESGPNARPMNHNWVSSIRNQCVGACVPFLFKQWGEWLPDNQNPAIQGPCGDTQAIRVGTKHAGRLLDGVLHDGYPKGGAA